MSLHKLIPSAVLLAVLAGCQTNDYNHFTSPEITGRVLAADTHQPLANVRVLRAGPGDVFTTADTPKGGQLLNQPAPVTTDASGHFTLASKSVFALFRSPGWWTTPVTFQLNGYETFQTNYTGSNVTSHAANGAPVVDAGDVLLWPATNPADR